MVILAVTLTSWFAFNLLFSRLFLVSNRYFIFLSLSLNALKSITTNNHFSLLFLTFAVTLVLLNLLTNIPLFSSPTIYYFFTVSLSLPLWLTIITITLSLTPSPFISHLLPFGSPIALSLLLPLIETFSHLLRPFTLIVRLSTNLSSGHIMLYIFSFFSLASPLITLSMSVVLIALLVLELGVTLLQAYIFTSLTILYLSE